MRQEDTTSVAGVGGSGRSVFLRLCFARGRKGEMRRFQLVRIASAGTRTNGSCIWLGFGHGHFRYDGRY